MKKTLALMVGMLILGIQVSGQKGSDDNTKRGYSLGLLPTISFDADMGFQYGGLISVYDYGFALNKNDGAKGLYINIGNLF